jgi:simple sugar transport system permease protein
VSRVAALPWGRLRGSNNEGVLVLALVALSIAVGISTPSFWSVPTLLDLLTNSMINVVFAMGVLLVIISGGIDVSFMAIGIFSGYSVIVVTNSTGFGAGHATVAFALASLIGLGLGLVNAGAVAGLRIPTLIATLGTQGIIRGAMLLWVGSRVIPDYPHGIDKLSNAYLVTAHSAAGDTRLSVLILPAVAICLVVDLILRYTMFGRSIYAIGGDEESARRAGIPVASTKVFIFALVGVLAGFAGMMHVTRVGLANPYELVGSELDVIAAVVLGGASIFGGTGSVTGTVLGVLLITLVKNSLILLGIPSTWQRFAVGMLLLIGITAQSLSASTRRRRPALAGEAPA